MNSIYKTITALALMLGAMTTLWGGSEKLSPELRSSELRSSKMTANVEIIVQYNVTPTGAHHLKVVKLGGTLRESMDRVMSAHYSVPASALTILSNDPDIAFIAPNRPL